MKYTPAHIFIFIFFKFLILYRSIYLNPLNIAWSVFNLIMLMFCNVGLLVFLILRPVVVSRRLKLMFERAFVGHRFDNDTPIAETVRGSTSEVDLLGIIFS